MIKAPLFLESQYERPFEQIVEKIREYVAQNGIQIVYIESLTSIVMRDVEAVNWLAKPDKYLLALRLLAKELDIAIIILPNVIGWRACKPNIDIYQLDADVAKYYIREQYSHSLLLHSHELIKVNSWEGEYNESQSDVNHEYRQTVPLEVYNRYNDLREIMKFEVSLDRFTIYGEKVAYEMPSIWDDYPVAWLRNERCIQKGALGKETQAKALKRLRKDNPHLSRFIDQDDSELSE